MTTLLSILLAFAVAGLIGQRLALNDAREAADRYCRWWNATRTNANAEPFNALCYDRATGKPRSPHWPAVRAAWLKDHPTCEACGGADDVEVHHKKMFHEHPELELDPDNFSTLCMHPSRQCHWQRGHLAKSWSVCNVHVVEDAAQFLERRKHAA